jgi:hypothetical protein
MPAESGMLDLHEPFALVANDNLVGQTTLCDPLITLLKPGRKPPKADIACAVRSAKKDSIHFFKFPGAHGCLAAKS